MVCGCPVEKIGAMARRRGVLMAVDAAQTAGLLDINLKESAIDYLCLPGHKGLYGPAGTGLLIVNCDLLPASLLEGGTGSFSMEAQMPDFLPDLLEAGTVNTPGILGLGAGIGFVLQHTPARLYRREMDLCAYLYRGLSRIDGVKLYSPPPRMGKSLPLIALNLGTLDSTRAAELLNEHHIAVRARFSLCGAGPPQVAHRPRRRGAGEPGRLQYPGAGAGILRGGTGDSQENQREKILKIFHGF